MIYKNVTGVRGEPITTLSIWFLVFVMWQKGIVFYGLNDLCKFNSQVRSLVKLLSGKFNVMDRCYVLLFSKKNIRFSKC